MTIMNISVFFLNFIFYVWNATTKKKKKQMRNFGISVGRVFTNGPGDLVQFQVASYERL